MGQPGGRAAGAETPDKQAARGFPMQGPENTAPAPGTGAPLTPSSRFSFLIGEVRLLPNGAGGPLAGPGSSAAS